MEGRIKFFDEKRGFGFVVPDDKSGDAFIHHTSIRMPGFRKLEQDQRVAFDIVQTDRGRKADNVVPL